MEHEATEHDADLAAGLQPAALQLVLVAHHLVARVEDVQLVVGHGPPDLRPGDHTEAVDQPPLDFPAGGQTLGQLLEVLVVVVEFVVGDDALNLLPLPMTRGVG